MTEPLEFYQTDLGSSVCAEITQAIATLVNEQADLFESSPVGDSLGVGYSCAFDEAMGYLNPKRQKFHALGCCHDLFVAHAENTGRTLVTETLRLPFIDEAFASIFVMHGLERAQHPADFMREIWRILCDRGLAIIVVPNRSGLWARGDHNPFGTGKPYTQGQIENFFQYLMFDIVDIKQALYRPPAQSLFLTKIAPFFEKIVKTLMPSLGGVHIVLLQKNRIAPIGKVENKRLSIIPAQISSP